MLELMVIVACLALMIIGSYTDLDRREVPDWLNYSMIFFGVGIAIAQSLFKLTYEPLIFSILGLIFGFLIGNLMFYTGQWGGGDSKMLMALGALIGLDYHFNSVPILILFVAYTFVFGAIYGMSWSLGVAILNRREFMKSWRKFSAMRGIKTMKILSFVISCIMIILFFFVDDFYLKLLVLMVAFMSVFMSMAFVFIKSVEKSCMLKLVPPTKLTEGDWIAKDVFYRGKRICGPKDLGISKENIEILVKLEKQGKIKKVLIKNGVPFVPSFLIAFLVLLFLGNIFSLLA